MQLSIGRFLLYFVLIALALYYIFPLYVMLSTSLKSLDEIRAGNLLMPPQGLNFDAWAKAWGSACTGVTCEGIHGFFWNSVKMTVPALFISTFLGAFNGYVLSKWSFKGSNIFFGLLLFGCFIPFQIIILPMASLLGKIGLANTTFGLVMVHVIYGLAFTTLFFRNFYASVPSEIVKAASIDGAGFFRIFFKIMLPLSTPIIVVTIIWQFTQIWNDFLFGIVFSSGESQPITVGLNNLINTSTGVKEYNVDMAAAIYAGLPTLLVYIFAGKYFVKGLTSGAVKG